MIILACSYIIVLWNPYITFIIWLPCYIIILLYYYMIMLLYSYVIMLLYRYIIILYYYIVMLLGRCSSAWPWSSAEGSTSIILLYQYIITLYGPLCYYLIMLLCYYIIYYISMLDVCITVWCLYICIVVGGIAYVPHCLGSGPCWGTPHTTHSIK